MGNFEIVPAGGAFAIDNPSLSKVDSNGARPTDEVAVQSIALQSIARALAESPSVSGFVPPAFARYLRGSSAAATRKAYAGDVADFFRWGGRLPCDGQTLCGYVADRANVHRPSTIERRVIGIGRAHAACGFPDPSKDALVRAVLRGVRREHGTAQRRATPMLIADLVAAVGQMRADLRGLRDRALLTLGFAGALRRSEIVQLDVEDLALGAEGLRIRLRRSKTDQERVGRTIAVPCGRTVACPVTAVKAWLEASGIQEGALFRAVSGGALSRSRLSDQSVSLIIKEHIHLLGLSPSGYSGHSLRAGFITSAAQAGVGFLMIQQQTGHRSVEMLNRYLRVSNPFAGNAAGALL